GRQGTQRVVNRLFERIIETRPRTRIHLRNAARIGAGTEPASSWGLCGVGRGTYSVGGTVSGRRGRGKSCFSHRNSTCRRLTVTSSRKMSLRGCRPTEVTG